MGHGLEAGSALPAGLVPLGPLDGAAPAALWRVADAGNRLAA
jgi:hypothetical protein